jgi:hypothetical protein
VGNARVGDSAKQRAGKEGSGGCIEDRFCRAEKGEEETMVLIAGLERTVAGSGRRREGLRN